MTLKVVELNQNPCSLTADPVPFIMYVNKLSADDKVLYEL